jgi:hypothetical protein
MYGVHGEQLAIAEFADALLVVPKTLAVNAAKVRHCAVQSVCCVVRAVKCVCFGGGRQLQVWINVWLQTYINAPGAAGRCRVCCLDAFGSCLQGATELLAKLRALHHTAQSSSDKRNLGQFGLDLVNVPMFHAVARIGCLQDATELAAELRACQHTTQRVTRSHNP